jgi:hypothetical protein
LYGAEEEMMQVTYSSITHINGLKEYYVIDSDMNKIRLKDARLAKERSVLLKAFFSILNPFVRITFTCQKEGSLNMDQLKSLVLDEIGYILRGVSKSERTEAMTDLDNCKDFGDIERFLCKMGRCYK